MPNLNYGRKIGIKMVIVALFFGVTSFTYAQSDLSDWLVNLSNYEKTEKTVVVDIYKDTDSYTVQSLMIVRLAYPYLLNNWGLKDKPTYGGRAVSFLDKILGYFTTDSLQIIECRHEIVKEKYTGGCEESPEGELTIMIPYFYNGKYAEIYDLDGNKILTIDLSRKAQCNENSQCEAPLENIHTCPSDCSNRTSQSLNNSKTQDTRIGSIAWHHLMEYHQVYVIHNKQEYAEN